MADAALRSDIELLQHFHRTLDAHFIALHASRAAHNPQAPIFALEHDLQAETLASLNDAVCTATSSHSLAHYRDVWLPFVVYATEIGYDYGGDEYWATFSSLTSSWTNQERKPSASGSCGFQIVTAALAQPAHGQTTSRSFRGRSRMQ